MRWEDQAIILHIAKHSNSSAVISLFTKNRGIENGFVKGIFSRKKYIHAGLIVDCTWSARLQEHLGNFTLSDAYNDSLLASIMSSNSKMFALQSIVQISKTCLMPSEPHNDLYELLYNFILHDLITDDWLVPYIKLELVLLDNIGFGLDLSECTVTKATEDLIYISPKTGKAVSAVAGHAYKDKLLALPAFFTGTFTDKLTIKEIVQALKVTGFFVRKFLENERGKMIPHSRIALEQYYIENYC